MKLVRVVAAIAATAGLAAPAVAASKQSHPPYAEGEVVVKFAPGGGRGAPATTAAGMRSMAAQAHSQARIAKTMQSLGMPRNALVRFPKDVSVEAMVARFKGMPGVEYAEPNYIASIPEPNSERPANKPQRLVRGKDGRARPMTEQELKLLVFAENNDPLAGNQDGWFWTGAEIVWPDLKPNPMVAVLDTGVDYTHPDLVGKVVKGFDWVNNDTDPMDDNGHGTHVSGIAAARVNNGTGVAGVSTAKIYAVKVLSGQGTGTFFEIAQGIVQAANNNSVKVINMSLGAGVGASILENAIGYAVNTKGKLIVASAGNGGADVPNFPAFYANNDLSGSAACAPSCPVFPAIADKVMAVAADGIFACTDISCAEVTVDYSCKAQFSQHGAWVSISAPGSNIFSTTPFHKDFWLNRFGGVAMDFDFLNGTSMASPMVAGAASRLLSATPALTNAQVKANLIATGFDTSASIGVLVDTDGNGSGDTPCWPTGNNPGMTDMNVASAMGRGAIVGAVYNASNGIPLSGAKVTAHLAVPAVGFGGVVDSVGDELYRILNVPAPAIVTLKVTKSGFASGAQAFASIDTFPAEHVGLPIVSVPPNKNWWFVSDWGFGGLAVGFDAELDQYVYTPSSSPLPCSVGYYGSCGTGALITAPFVRSMHEGGPIAGDTSMESTAIRPPLFSTATGTPYEAFLDSYGASTNLTDSGAVARLWFNGVIKGTVDLAGATGSCPASECTWYIGNLSSTGVFTPVNSLGTICNALDLGSCPGGIQPFGFRNKVGPSPGRGGAAAPGSGGPRRSQP